MRTASVQTLFSLLVLVAFFNRLSSEPDIDKTATSYSIAAGVMFYKELSIENTFAGIKLKHDPSSLIS